MYTPDHPIIRCIILLFHIHPNPDPVQFRRRKKQANDVRVTINIPNNIIIIYKLCLNYHIVCTICKTKHRCGMVVFFFIFFFCWFVSVYLYYLCWLVPIQCAIIVAGSFGAEKVKLKHADSDICILYTNKYKHKIFDSRTFLSD